jgi:hypothetical protein
MSRHIPDEVSTRIDWSACGSIGNVMPPRDPDEEDGEEDEEDEKDDRADEPAVVREPDED